MQGYVVLACGKQKYYEMAMNIARSIRVFDSRRSVCLIHDAKIKLTEECQSLFEKLVLMPADENFLGVMNKARVFDFSPYDKTMYVDADMLLFKPNIEAYWRALDGHYFDMAGGKRTEGYWYGKDIAEIISTFNIPYLVQMNSGVFYFEKNERAALFFERVKALFRSHKDSLSRIHQNVPGQYADEPVFGVVMGEAQIEPMQTIEGEGSWMVTTWQSRNLRFNPENGVSYLQRSTGYPFRMHWLSRSWVDHSPNFVHFINLSPKREYNEAVKWFRNRLATAGSEA